MKISARFGRVMLMAVALWSFGDHLAAASRQPSDARQAQQEPRSNPWNWLKSRATQLQAAARRKATSEAATDPNAAGRIGWTFHQIDAPAALGRLERFGLKIPVAVEGRLTIKARVGVPWRTILQTRNYRLSAHVQSGRLTVAGIELDDLDANLSYAEGLLKLSELRFTTPDLADADAKVGVRGTAQVQLEPRGDLTANVDFERLSLGRILKDASPAAEKASGEIAGHAEARVAVSKFRDLAAWGGKAHLSMPKFRLAGSRELAVTADLGLADGIASLSRLAIRMKDSTATITGDATAQLQPRGELKARLNVNRLELGPLLESIPAADGMLGGELTARFAASAPVSRLQDSAAWRASGRLNAGELRIVGLPPAQLEVDFQLADGRLALPKINGRAEFFDLAGSGRLDLTDELAYATNLRLTSSRLSRLNELKGQLSLPIEIGGRLGASAAVQGALKPRRFSARGAVTARDVRVEGVAFDQLDFRYNGDLERLQLHPLNAVLYGGRLSASAVIPLEDGEIRAGVRWNDLELEPLVERFAKLGGPLKGRASGTLQVRLPRAALDDPTKWAAEGRMDFDRLGFAGLDGGGAGADFKLAQGDMQLSKLEATLGSATLAGALEVGIATPFDFSGKLALSNGDLALLNLLPGAWKPPLRLAGRAGVSADFQGAFEPPRLTGAGALVAKLVRADKAQIDSISAKFSADGRQLRLGRLQASLYQGELQGSLAIPLAPHVPADVELDWRQVRLGRLLADLQLAPRAAAGSSQGRIKLTSDANDLRDLQKWQGEVSIDAADVNVFGWRVRRAALAGKLKDGAAELAKLSIETDAPAQGRAATLTGAGRLQLAAPYGFQARFDLADFDLSRLQSLPPPWRPPIELGGRIDSSGEAQGTLDPLQATGQGKLAAAGVNIAGAQIDSVALKVVVDDQSLQLKDVAAELYGGRIAGDIVLPLAESAAGRAALDFERLDLGQMASDLGHLPVKVRGKIDGELQAKVPAGRLGHVEDWELHASFDAPEIDVDAVRIGRLHARVDYQRTELDYQVDGELLAGRWEVAGAWQPPGEEHREGANRGHVKLDGAQLGRLGEILRRRGALDSLAGTLNVRLDFQHDPQSGRPVGKGRFDVEGLRFNGAAWADRVVGVVSATPDRIRLESLTGSIAGGRARATGAIYLAQGRRGQFRVSLEGVDLGRLLSLVSSETIHVQGVADLELLVFSGQGRPWQFNGTVAISEAEVDGIAINDMRIPLEGAFDPGSGRGELRLRAATAQLAHGHVTASAVLTSANSVTIDGQGKFTDVNVRQLLRTSATASQYGTGKMTGDFTIAGRNVRSLRDLTGSVKAKLRNTDAASLPLAQTLQSYVSGGLAGSGRFGNGELRARLARGVVRVERLSLSSQNMQIYAQGSVSLAGRLNLSVVVNTGQINSTPAALLLAARLSTLLSPPVGLLLQANQLLSNQVVYLDVTGTVHSPTVRVRPLPLLEEEVVRFFLVGAPIP